MRHGRGFPLQPLIAFEPFDASGAVVETTADVVAEDALASSVSNKISTTAASSSSEDAETQPSTTKLLSSSTSANVDAEISVSASKVSLSSVLSESEGATVVPLTLKIAPTSGGIDGEAEVQVGSDDIAEGTSEVFCEDLECQVSAQKISLSPVDCVLDNFIAECASLKVTNAGLPGCLTESETAIAGYKQVSCVSVLEGNEALSSCALHKQVDTSTAADSDDCAVLAAAFRIRNATAEAAVEELLASVAGSFASAFTPSRGYTRIGMRYRGLTEVKSRYRGT